MNESLTFNNYRALLKICVNLSSYQNYSIPELVNLTSLTGAIMKADGQVYVDSLVESGLIEKNYNLYNQIVRNDLKLLATLSDRGKSLVASSIKAISHMFEKDEASETVDTTPVVNTEVPDNLQSDNHIDRANHLIARFNTISPYHLDRIRTILFEANRHIGRIASEINDVVIPSGRAFLEDLRMARNAGLVICDNCEGHIESESGVCLTPFGFWFMNYCNMLYKPETEVEDSSLVVPSYTRELSPPQNQDDTMTNDNIFNFPVTKAYEKQSAGKKEMISDLCNKFTTCMEKSLPMDIFLTQFWVTGWIQKACNMMTRAEEDQLINDRAMIEMLELSSPVLSRLFTSIAWPSLYNRFVTFADCAGADDIVNYPAPMALYHIGTGCILCSRYIMFDKAFDKEDLLQQMIAHKGCHYVSVWRDDRALPGPHTEYSVVDTYIINKLAEAFYTEAILAQRGYKVNVSDDGVTLIFLRPVSDHGIMEWKLNFKTDVYVIAGIPKPFVPE